MIVKCCTSFKKIISTPHPCKFGVLKGKKRNVTTLCGHFTSLIFKSSTEGTRHDVRKRCLKLGEVALLCNTAH